MRKVEVTRCDQSGPCDVDSNGAVTDVSLGGVENIFGEFPPVGETRTYYIVPAGDVAEFECQTVGMYGRVEIRRVDNKFGLTEFRENFRQLFGFVPGSKDARRVTAIVHPPDEPKESVSGRAVERLRDFTERLEAGEDIDGIPPAKQPILLKRNNTPTRPGNYVLRQDNFSLAKLVHVYEDGFDLLCNDGDEPYSVDLFEWWSDELGPIQFESEPEPPPMPKVGWFEHKGIKHSVVDTGYDSQPFVVTPEVCTQKFGLSRWQSPRALIDEGIRVTWHGDVS